MAVSVLFYAIRDIEYIINNFNIVFNRLWLQNQICLVSLCDNVNIYDSNIAFKKILNIMIIYIYIYNDNLYIYI